MKPNYNELKDTHTKSHFNLTFKRQRQREGLKSSNSEVTCHIQGIFNTVISRFLIRIFAVQEVVS